MISPSARICDLGLTLAESRFAPLLEQLRAELRGAGIVLWPRFYLSTEYGCVGGTSTIGLLWTDGFAAAQRMAAERGIRTRRPELILGVLRHEVGHAFCYVHKLWRTPRFRELFGVKGGFFSTYPEPWHPRPADRRRVARGEVIHVYAARHADEDFAVSFEYWLGARDSWRRRFRHKPRVLEKLAYVEETAARVGWRETPPDTGPLDVPLDVVDATVDDWMRSVVVGGAWTLLAKHHEPRSHSPAAVKRRLRRSCLAHGVDYDLGDGRRVPIDVLPSPLALTGTQESFLHHLSERINHYLRRMPGLYLSHPEVREVMPLPPAEHEFLADCWRPAHARLQSLVGRNDLDMPEDPRSTVAFEPNGCAIGGIFYAGAVARVINEVVVSDETLGRRHQGLLPLTDGCDLVADLLQAHAAALGAPTRPRIGVLEHRDWDAGITEMPRLLAHLRQRGLSGVIGDPRELSCARGRFRLRGEPIDLVYRNMELTDLVGVEAEAGGPLEPLRRAFRENRVISGLAGDFDHKSLWELLTSSATRHLVEPADRRLFRRHLLWTRRLRHVVTENPDGERVELVPWARAHRRQLVIKPNTACGGEGVTLGPLLDQRAWERAVARALRDPAGWVVQRFHHNTRRQVGPRRYYVTYGVISSPAGCCVLSRASGQPVVNVSRGGGLVAVFGRR